MKSLNFHVCHILPPYGKACPHALKLLTMCPTMWLPYPKWVHVYKPKLTIITNQLLGTSNYIQLYILLANNVKMKDIHFPSHRGSQCREIDYTTLYNTNHKHYSFNTLQFISVLSQ